MKSTSKINSISALTYFAVVAGMVLLAMLSVFLYDHFRAMPPDYVLYQNERTGQYVWYTWDTAAKYGGDYKHSDQAFPMRAMAIRDAWKQHQQDIANDGVWRPVK